MDVSRVPPDGIVVGTDGSPCSDGAVDWAADQAALEGRSLTIVHGMAPIAQSLGAYPAGGLEVARLVDDMQAFAQTMLASAVARARGRAPGVEVNHALEALDPRTLLFGLADRAALVVVGSRGRGPVASLLLGSVSVSVSRHAACPVVVWRAGGTTTPRHRILVGVDGTAHSAPAAEFAFRMASLRRSTLTVLHRTRTVPPVAGEKDEAPPLDLSEEAMVRKSIEAMSENYPDVAVEVRLVGGAVEQHLVSASRDHDLVVVGHERIGHLRELVQDSVAPAVLEQAHGPVAVVPSQPRVGC